MTKVEFAYTPDGEWLSITTNPHRDPHVFAIEPVLAEETTETDPETGWTRKVYPSGHFQISAPYSNPLHDWGIELHGVARNHDQLNTDVMSSIFGEEILDIVNWYSSKYRERKFQIAGSAGRLLSRSSSDFLGKGIIQKDERLLEANLNRQTMPARSIMLGSESIKRGRLAVSRSLLFSEY